jgi:hypothetical protein
MGAPGFLFQLPLGNIFGENSQRKHRPGFHKRRTRSSRAGERD